MPEPHSAVDTCTECLTYPLTLTSFGLATGELVGIVNGETPQTVTLYESAPVLFRAANHIPAGACRRLFNAWNQHVARLPPTPDADSGAPTRHGEQILRRTVTATTAGIVTEFTPGGG